MPESLEMSRLTVPLIAVLTGEGDSGGAGAGCGRRLLMLENAVRHLSPEGFTYFVAGRPARAERGGEADEAHARS